MILIFTLVVFVIALLVVPAVSALSFYIAGNIADSQTNNYVQNYLIALKIIFIAGLIVGAAKLVYIDNEVFSLTIYIGAFCWMVCILMDLLTIKGMSNTCVFVSISLLLNLLVYVAFHYMLTMATIHFVSTSALVGF